MARICRGLLPEQITKKSVKPGGLAQVEHDEVRRLLVFGRAHREHDLLGETDGLSGACQSWPCNLPAAGVRCASASDFVRRLSAE